MKYNEVYNSLKEICLRQKNEKGKIFGSTAEEIANILNMQRSNVVREFSRLIENDLVTKTNGRPVRYLIKDDVSSVKGKTSIFESMIGSCSSLKNQAALAKAAIVYPPSGLHTLIIGETGVGKSYFARAMFKYAVECGMIKNSDKYAVFNCADYSNNPELIMGHLFGVVKGAYTGAVEDRDGIIERARDGILFLDEVHRLPPEGQEMLFTIIDEGKYVKLGSTKEIPINVMIISATTENIESSLLKTFTRRIPVIISLPPLRERTVDERFELVKNFFEEESKRIGKKIDVDKEAITALLNYECINNIGELKSDIQIACAKAFLRSVFDSSTVNVSLEDFNEKVRAGILKANKISPSRLKIKLNDNFNDISEEDDDKYSLSKNIYEFMERRTSALKNRGLNIDEIKLKVYSDVEKYINTYLNSINSGKEEDELKRIVNGELYDFLSAFIPLAEYRLSRKISRNIFLGLLVHLDAFLERARENKIIENPKLEEVRQKYPQEFKLAMLLGEKIEHKFSLRVPLDEIGFITMFFASDTQKNDGRVIVIIAMHGNSTASSMAEVVNHLLNTNHAIGFDMPLSMRPEDALKRIEYLLKERHEGKGALLLVDMGSLRFFDKMISTDIGIEVKCVDMVTTVMALKAVRMALMNASLEDIISSINAQTKSFDDENDKANSKKRIIISACSTGEGTAQRIKDIIYKKYDNKNYEVVNLSIKDKDEFINAVNKIKKSSTIEAIVSPFAVNIEGVKYISMDSLFEEFLYNNIFLDKNYVQNIITVYKDYLDINDADYIIDIFMNIIKYLINKFKIHIDNEKLNGILMHFGCLVEKLLNREDTPKCENTGLIKSKHYDIYEYFKIGLSDIEKRINVSFSDDDISNIIEMLISL